jgi:hypothetical protein
MLFLYRFPDPIIILIFGGGLAIICAAVIIAFNRFLPRDQSKEIDLVLRVMTNMSAILIFLLALSIVQAKSDLNRVQEGINVEARGLGELDRLMLRFDPAATSSARETLARYTQTLIVEEWPLLEQGSSSLKVGELALQLTRQVEEIEPHAGGQQTIFTELVRGAAAVEHRRDERLFHAANTRLPTSFWIVILVLLCTIALTGAFFRPTVISVIMVAAQAAMFGVLIAFLFILDEPFLGDSAVTPRPIIRVYATLSEAPKVGPLPRAPANTSR